MVYSWTRSRVCADLVLFFVVRSRSSEILCSCCICKHGGRGGSHGDGGCGSRNGGHGGGLRGGRGPPRRCSYCGMNGHTEYYC